MAAVVGGLQPGLLATAVGAIWEAAVYLPPDGPPVGDPADQARLALFVLGGVLMSALSELGLRARIAAERSARRATTLAELSAALNVELTRVDIAHEALRRTIRAVGAARGAWFVPDETGTALLTTVAEGYPEATVADYRRVPYDAPLPAAEAARTMRPVLVGTAEQYRARYPGAATLVPQSPTVAMAAQPVIAEGRLLGVLGWGYTQEQAFDAGTAEFLDAIGSLTAQALQSAAAFDREQGARRQAEEANRRLDVIVGAGQALGATLDYETTPVAMARVAIPYLGEVCAVDILEDGGVRRSVATVGDALADVVAGLEAWPVRPGSDHPIAQAMRESRTIVRDVDDDWLRDAAQSEEHARVIAASGLRRFPIVPLLGRERAVGALTFATRDPDRRYEEADVVVAETLAQRAAKAWRTRACTDRSASSRATSVRGRASSNPSSRPSARAS